MIRTGRLDTPLVVAIGLALACGAVSRPARAESPAPADKWQIAFAPYVMGASLDGTVAVKGQEAEIEVSASKIFENLQFGFMSMLSARKGNWGVGGDALYVQLGVATDRPAGDFDPTLLIATVQGIHRLSSWADLTFGARWNHIDAAIDLDAPLNFEAEKTRQWVDPIVGVVLRTPAGHRWHGMLMTDIGGTDADSDFTWQIFPTVGYDLSKKVSIEGGYRFLETDYETGDGTDRFEYDMLYKGPVLGMKIVF